jgi:hypothetical protein
MLFAKLKLIVLGVVSVALVTTGVGVVAQTGPAPHPDQDRLKAVEQKLDRLLEVLGGSNRSEVRYPPVMPPPASVTIDPAPGGSYSPSVSALPSPAALPPSPEIASTTSTVTSPSYGGSLPGGSASAAATLPHGQSQSLELRVRTLEQRLSEMERRFGEMERRLSRVQSGPFQSTVPPGTSSSWRRDAGGKAQSQGDVRPPSQEEMPPHTPRAAKPSSADTVPQDPRLTDGPSTAATIPPTMDSGSPAATFSADTAPESIPRSVKP